MKKALFIVSFLALTMQAMQPTNDKEYYENVMGSLVLVKETETADGIKEINGTFRKGDKVTCRKDSNGKTEAQFITKKGDTIDPEILGESSDHLYNCLSKRASVKSLLKSQKEKR